MTRHHNWRLLAAILGLGAVYRLASDAWWQPGGQDAVGVAAAGVLALLALVCAVCGIGED